LNFYLGAPKAGKTSLINWFFGKSYRDNYIPTIEDFHRKIYKIRGEIYRLDILDMSGNDPFPAMKNLNIMLGDLFIVVFSIDDIDSYTQMKKICEQIIEIKKLKQNSKVNSPILVVGNKLDLLYDNRIKSRCFNSVDFEKFLSTFKSTFYHETSCKNSIGTENYTKND
jgi:small GTP-binding protein